MTEAIETAQSISLVYFGDPYSAVDPVNIADYLGVFYNNSMGYYIPPVSLRGMVQLMKANPHHGTLPSFKAQMLLKYLVKNKLVAREDLKRCAIDYNAMANGYLQLIRNRTGQVIEVKHQPGVNIRRISDNQYGYLVPQSLELIKFKVGEIWHLMDYDPLQQFYGIPYWFGAVQSILLGEDSRLFPRRFFKNGAHMGNLIVTSGLMPKEEAILKEKLEKGQGIGNFRTAHIGMPGGEVEKTLKVIPIGEIGSKIEFTKFASQSKSDILSAWRFRPELIGSMPDVGTSGDLEKIMMMNYENEIIPFQQDFEQLNDELPAAYKIRFDDANGKVF